MTTIPTATVIDTQNHLTPDECSLLADFRDVQQITVERLLKGGLSGAKIVVADVKFGTEALIKRYEGPKIIKIGPVEEIKREVDNHTEARQGIEAHTPELILWVEQGSHAAMLLQIAGGSADQISSLNDLIKDRRHEEVVKSVAGFCTEVMGVWTPLAKLYEVRHETRAGDWFRDALNCGSFSGDRPDEVLTLAKALTGNPLPEELWVRVDGHKEALPNPAIFLDKPHLWGKAVIAAPRGKIHGDLHSGNLISPYDSLGQTPTLIDFGRFQRDQLIFFDLAYLELDLLLHRMADREANEWLRLIAHLMSALAPKHGVGDGYEYCASLRAGAIRAYLQQVIEAQPPDLRPRFEGAWWLAATAAGLVFSRRSSYSDQSQDKGESAQFKREARLCYLYSAFACRQLIRPFPMNLGEFSQPVPFYIDPPQAAAAPAHPQEIAPARALEQAYAAALRDHFRELAAEFTELGAVTRPETLNPPAADTHPDRRPLTPFNKRFGARPQKQDYSRASTGSEAPHRQPVRDLRQTLAELDRLVLLGEPGAGKTTTLMRLTYEYGTRLLDEPENLIPVFVALGEYRGTTEAAFRAHVQSAVEVFAPDLGPHTPYLLKHNRLLLLCDALNEMSAEEKVLSSLQKALRGVDHVILSCREKDFSGGKLTGAGVFHQVDIQPLTPPQIREMIGRFLVPDEAENPVTLSAEAQQSLWERELRGSDLLLDGWAEMDTAGERDPFWVDADPPGILLHQKSRWSGNWYPDNRDDARRAMLRDKRGLMLLCRNPFMLSMVIQTFHAQGTLPENRGALYESFVLALLERDKLAVRDDSAPETPLRTTAEGEQLVTALMRLAEQMQLRQNITDYPRSSALEVLGEGESGLEALRQAVGCSLLVDKGSSVGFSHQLLAEYFASKVMGEKLDQASPASTIWKPQNWWERTGQEVTAHLLAGSRAAVGEAELIKVIQWLGEANPELAYEAALEAGLSEETLTAILERPAQNKAEYDFSAHTWKAVNPDPHGRASAWRVLGKLREDKRPGVLDFNIPWCKVPAGEFTFGGDPDSNNKTAQRITLPYDYWIAPYPVTYAQYERFVAEGGYTDKHRDCWTDAGWAWKGDKTTSADYWNDPRWHILNHPVVGVTWYEAYAFTRWLNALTPRPPLPTAALGEGVKYELRLPTEAEWEKAARYPDERKFPWGDKFDSAKCNTSEGKAGRTTAVGIYPQGKQEQIGAFDLSGNVWEWCLSKWADPYRHPEDNAPEGDSPRGLRGGSWYSLDLRSRAAYRDLSYPALRGDVSYGFRVVVAPVSLGLFSDH